MATWAAVMTGSGPGALATIQLQGNEALSILQTIFQPQAGSTLQDRVGQIRVGTLQSGQQVIDQITLGQEGPQTWSLHCHGNPLITESILSLLNQEGAPPITSHHMLLRLEPSPKAIALEARQVLSQSKTLLGCRLLHHQINNGLSRIVQQWQQQSNLALIQQQCGDILQRSRWIHACLTGISTVLIGPPNSGKSTLLNTLAGRSKAIVTDIAGTTRDTVEAEIVIEPLCFKITDTAGLDVHLNQDLDQASQQKSLEALQQADLIIVVLDRSRDASQLEHLPLSQLHARPIVTLLNKADLPGCLSYRDLPGQLQPATEFCAQQTEQIPQLIQAVQNALGLQDLAVHSPIAFTPRQQLCLQKLQQVRDIESLHQALAILQTPPDVDDQLF